MARTRIHTGELVPPIQALEGYLQKGGVTILRAAFEHSFFVDPVAARSRTPYFPNRARFSRKRYPGKRKGDRAIWSGREVVLDDNAYAQQAWEHYTGRRIYRGSGYGVRHVWGNPWNPDAFTAGWNLCYMPFWAGMLTEGQHPHPKLRQAVQQASWDLFFRDNPECTLPDFVGDPGMDLDAVLGDQPLLILKGETDTAPPPGRSRMPTGIRLWEEYIPVRFGNRVLMEVAECISRRQVDHFADRILTLTWASRHGGKRWKRVGSTEIYLNVNFRVDKLISRSRDLLEHFGYHSSDLEVLYD